MLTNPPYGKEWSSDQEALKVSKKGSNVTCNDPRFQIGSRIASVHNGSSLFNSDSGMITIRKHIIENDLLEAIIALPKDLFYNTGIPTFIWILSNNKSKERKGKVQLINRHK